MSQISVCAVLWKRQDSKAVTKTAQYMSKISKSTWSHHSMTPAGFIWPSSQIQGVVTPTAHPLFGAAFSDQSNARRPAEHPAITFYVIVEGTGPCGHLSSAHVNLKHISRVPSKEILGLFRKTLYRKPIICLQAASTMFSVSKTPCTVREVCSAFKVCFSVAICKCQTCDIMSVQCNYNIPNE